MRVHIVVEELVQCAIENARRAPRTRQIFACDNGSAETAGNRFVAMLTIQSEYA